MEFPITRQRLQNYMNHEALYADVKKRVAQEMKLICSEVESIVVTTVNQKYIYKINSVVKYGTMLPSNTLGHRVSSVGILKELLNAITLYFPDCTIQIDPLETYIVIDWS